MGCNKNTYKREVIRDKCIYQEKRKMLNKQPNFTSEGTRERRTNQAQSKQNKGKNND